MKKRLLTFIPIGLYSPSSPPLGGRPHEASCGREEMRRPRAGTNVPPHPGGPGTPPGGHYDPSARSFAGLGLRPIGFRRGLRGKTGLGPLLQEPRRRPAQKPGSADPGPVSLAKAGGAKPRWSAGRRPRSWQQERGKTEDWCAARCSIPSLCARGKNGPARRGRVTAYPAPIKNTGAGARLLVIPGRAKREPGIQMQTRKALLDSGSGPSDRPGMTEWLFDN